MAVGAIISLPLLTSCKTKKILAEQQAQLTELQQEIDRKNAVLNYLNDEIQKLYDTRNQLTRQQQ